MLKALMLKRDIDLKEEALRGLEEKDAGFAAREAELTAAIGEVKADEERSAVEEMVNAFDAERSAHETAKEELRGAIEALRAQLAEVEKNQKLPATAPEQRGSGNMKEVSTMPFTRNNVNIRTLPHNQRAFEAVYDLETRKAIVAQPELQEFFAQLRSLGAARRDVSGAELTIPVVLLELIAENMFRYSKLMNRVRVVNVRGEARQTIAGLVPPAVWTECCAALNELTFSFGQWPMSCWKVAGFVTICNSQLNDSDINLAGALVEMISMSIGMSKDMAIIYGTGNGMPLGIVTRLAQQSQPANYPATAPQWIDLHTSNILTVDGTLTGAAFWAALTVATGNTFTRYSRGELFWA